VQWFYFRRKCKEVSKQVYLIILSCTLLPQPEVWEEVKLWRKGIIPKKLISFIFTGLNSEGLYRVSGFSDLIEDVKMAFDRGMFFSMFINLGQQCCLPGRI